MLIAVNTEVTLRAQPAELLNEELNRIAAILAGGSAVAKKNKLSVQDLHNTQSDGKLATVILMKNISQMLLAVFVFVFSTTAQAQIGLTKIADGSTTVPGAPATTFKDFHNPAFHNGQVAFRAINSANAPGLYLFNGSTIVKLADTNTAAPNGGNFTNIQFDYGLENGAVAFFANDTNGAAIFLWTNGVTTRLAKRGDAIPGTATNKFTTFGQPVFDNGTVYFIGADSTNYQGVHRFDGVLSTGLVSSLQTYPPTALPHQFSSQLTVESNRLAVWSYANPNTQPNAIFTWTNGVKNFLVSSNDAIPGAGVNFHTFQSPPDMRNGTVAFWGGSVANFQEGIFLRPFAGGAITPMVRRNDPNAGASGGLTSFYSFSLDDNQAWFYAGGSGGESLFLWQSNSYRRVLSGGMKIGTRPIQNSGGFVLVPRAAHGGVAAFVAKFNDLTSGLYITTNLPPVTTSFSLAVTNLVSTNTPLPGGTGFFTFMTSVRLWQNGAVFNGGGTNNQSGIYHCSNGVCSLILNRSTIFPGSTTNVLGFAVYALDATRLLIGMSTPDGRQGIFIYDGSGFRLVADFNTTIPSGSFGNFTSFPGFAQFNGENVTFMARGTNNQYGIYEFNGSGLTRILDSTTSFPGTANPLSLGAFARQGSLFGLIANNSILTYTNGTFNLITTNMAAIPGHPNRVFGTFNSPGFYGGQLYFAAQALSTVDSFSGTYLMRADADGSNLTVVVDENTYLPGLTAGAASLTYFIEPSGIFINALNGGQRAIYYLNGMVAENLLDTSNPPNGVPLIGVTVSSGGLSTSGAAFAASSFTNGPLVYFSPPAASTGPSGGQFAPGSVVWSPGGTFCMDFTGGVNGNTYRIQYNLTPGSTNWVTFTNFTYANPITICDNSATNQMRLYRAVSP
jgi:hypothetical protein